MTYNKIFNYLYSGNDNRSVTDLAPEDRLPWQVIRFFDGRGGFDHWWGSLKPAIQNEIFNELRKLLNKDVSNNFIQTGQAEGRKDS